MSRPETRFQQHVRMWWRRWGRHVGPWSLYAIEHGRRHFGDEEERAREWGRLKAKGVIAGIEDLQAIGPNRIFIAIELKVASPQTDQQEKRQASVEACGFPYHIARSVERVALILRDAGCPLPVLALEDARAEDRALASPGPVKKAARPRQARPDRKSLAAIQRAAARGVAAV